MSSPALAWLGGAVLRAVVLLLLTSVVVSNPASGPEQRFRRAAGPSAMDMVGWEVGHLAARATRLLGALAPGVESLREDERDVARAYFAAAEDGVRAALRSQVEVMLERGLSTVLRQQQVAPILPLEPRGLLFPPVSLTLSPLPKLLIVSPRDRIQVSRSLLLAPSVDWAEAQRIEEELDNGESVSLVVPIGGLSTYPAMIPESSDRVFLLETVAHEWTHAYLFFTPLGQRYWGNYQARTINETAADMVGKELGAELGRELGLPSPSQERRAAPTRRGDFSFSAEMRVTRVAVDRLLANGQVEQAEDYMRERRDLFAAHGYQIRKLNQAYFAFNGSYAGGGAGGASPVPGQLQRLRQQSGSLGKFLQRVGQLTSLQDLARAAGG